MGMRDAALHGLPQVIGFGRQVLEPAWQPAVAAQIAIGPNTVLACGPMVPTTPASGPRATEPGGPGASGGPPRPSCDWMEGNSPHNCRFRALTEFLTQTLELDELIQAATAFVHNLVRAETVRIWLFRRGGQRLVSREFDPAAPDGVSELVIRSEE